MPEISIIVPVYNMEKYIRKSLDSILVQNFADFEAILVDDGSKDSSGIICDEYARKDSRFKVFHKENGGLSNARNYGIERAKGKWVTSIDPDDWVSPDYLENFHKAILANPTGDIFVVSFCRVSDDGVYIGKHKSIEGEFSVKDSLLKNNLFLTGYFWNTLYRLDIIRKYKLIFNEHFSMSEDMIFKLEYLRYIDKVFYIDSADYFYRQNPTSLTKKKYSIEVENDLLNAYEESLSFLLKKEEYSFALWDSILMFIFRVFSSMYNIEPILDKKDRIKLLKEYSKKYKKEIKICTNIPRLISDIWALKRKTREVKKYMIGFKLASLFLRFKLYFIFDILFMLRR